MSRNHRKRKTYYNLGEQQSIYRRYKTYYQDVNGRKYSKESIKSFLERPSYYETQIRQISLYLASMSSHYSRMVNYLATMLTLDYIVTPNGEFKSEKEMLSKLKRANDYIEKFNIKHEISKILPTLLIEDAFFGYEVRNDDIITIMPLPNRYCKIIGIEDGIYIFTFDFSYFTINEEILKSFPNEFKEKYAIFKKTGQSEQILENNLGAICFKLREDLTYQFPFFAPLFEDLIELQEKKDIADEKELLNNYKLLIQKIPLKKDARTEQDMIFKNSSIQIFHENLSHAVPDQVSVVTTPMDIEEINLMGKTNLDNSNLADAQELLFTSSGFGNMFSGKNKTEIAIKLANMSDQTVMFRLLRQFERFFNKRIKRELNNDKRINIIFPDITHFNRKEKIEEYLKLAQFGYPKSLVAITTGLTQSQFLGLNNLENSLNILESLIPLRSSHTQVQEENSVTNDIGRPEEEV